MYFKSNVTIILNNLSTSSIQTDIYIEGKNRYTSELLSPGEIFNKIFSFTKISEYSTGISIQLDRTDNIGWANGTIIFHTIHQGFSWLFYTVILPVTAIISLATIIIIIIFIWPHLRSKKQQVTV